MITTLIDELLEDLRAAQRRRDASPSGTAAWASADREVQECRDALRGEARRVAARPMRIPAMPGASNPAFPEGLRLN